MDYEPNRVKGVVPKVYGGLGNQMFEIAAGLCISLHNNCPLYLPKNPFNHSNNHNTGIDYYNTIFKNIGIHLEEPECDVICKIKDFYSEFKNDGFGSWSVYTIQPGTIIDSYFQFYPALEAFEDILRKKFLENLPKLDIQDNSAFLHIRRGDYLNYPNFHFIQPISYYEKAFFTLLEKSPNKINKIYILSDDIEWASQQDFFQNPIFECVKENNELQALSYMAHCTAGAICANSTFSWWGAFLGAHGKRNPVIVPSRWINCKVEKLFPEEWIVV